MYRVGKKQKRALLTKDGHLIALFEKGHEGLAELTCKLLNEQCNIANVVGRSEQLHSCKYVKRIGESCTLNNNCKYPNCE